MLFLHPSEDSQEENNRWNSVTIIFAHNNKQTYYIQQNVIPQGVGVTKGPF